MCIINYNYRYYDPQLGRWTKRDPIEEEGRENLYIIGNNDIVNKLDYFGLGDIYQLLGAPAGVTWWHLAQELERDRYSKKIVPNTKFWYCERNINPEELSFYDKIFSRVSYVQHAYISIGYNPWAKNGDLSGYGFSGSAQKPGTLPLPERAFNPGQCRPCYKDKTNKIRQLQHGAGKGTCCERVTDEQIISCISSAPIKRKYSKIRNQYVCWTCAEETLAECCLNCSKRDVTKGMLE